MTHSADHEESDHQRYALKSVTSAFNVLEFLVESGESGISEIARGLDMNAGTVHRLVATLVSVGVAEQDPDSRRYRPSLHLASIGAKVASRIGLESAARPHLDRLMRQTGETVNLGVLRGAELLYVDKVFPDEILRIEIQVGSRVPAVRTALGKAILAFSDEADVSAVLAAEVDAEQPVHPGGLLRELQKVRDLGFAEDKGELFPDVACLAAPVLGASGRAVAAISVSAPRSRMEGREDQIAPLVAAAAREVSAFLNVEAVAM